MKSVNRPLAALGACALLSQANPAAAAGLPTRDLNPVLQPILIPSMVPVNPNGGWRVDHSLYITNTQQETSRGNESVIIDVENYRYEFALSHSHERWRTQIRVPLMANRSGELDTLIEDWHDFFGLPQGDRDSLPKDQIFIEYERDGVVEYSQTESSSGLGDIALSLGYQAENSNFTYYGAIELPTGSESDYTGNEAIDFALWIEMQTVVSSDTDAYGMFGFSFPGDDGGLEGLLVDYFWVAQLGLEYGFSEQVLGMAQLDMHGETIDNSDLRPFGNSVQIQLGLGFPELFENHRLDLFFSEDIYVESAPDITFGLRLSRNF